MSDKDKLYYLATSIENVWEQVKNNPNFYTTEERLNHLTNVLYELIRIVQRQG